MRRADPEKRMADNIAYKILTSAQMTELEQAKRFAGAPVDLADGYIHLSSAEQLEGTLDKHFAGQTGLWLVAVDLDAAADQVKWEVSRGDALFPHLYGELTLDTVLAWSPVEYEPDGALRLPVAG
jgi:uncharacterized protein (DUF952 family)